MNTKSFKTKGGSGGKRGHSNMTHWMPTEIIKVVSKKAMREESRRIIRNHLNG